MHTRLMVFPVWILSLVVNGDKSHHDLPADYNKFLRNPADAASLFWVLFFFRLRATALIPFLYLHLTGAQDN